MCLRVACGSPAAASGSLRSSLTPRQGATSGLSGLDRDLTDIFVVQDDAGTAKIVSALSLQSQPRPTFSAYRAAHRQYKAYDCYLRGRALWQRSAKEPNAQARALLERAVELDPKFASAHALLSIVYNFDYINEWSASPSE